MTGSPTTKVVCDWWVQYRDFIEVIFKTSFKVFKLGVISESKACNKAFATTSRLHKNRMLTKLTRWYTRTNLRRHLTKSDTDYPIASDYRTTSQIVLDSKLYKASV